MNKEFPYKLIDLTHTLSEKTPSWNGGCGFNHDIKLDYQAESTKVTTKLILHEFSKNNTCFAATDFK